MRVPSPQPACVAKQSIRAPRVCAVFARCMSCVMAEPTVRLISDARVAIGESPAALSNGVYWTDPVSRRLLKAARNGELQSIPTASSVWSLAEVSDELVGSLDDRFCTISKSGEV